MYTIGPINYGPPVIVRESMQQQWGTHFLGHIFGEI